MRVITFGELLLRLAAPGYTKLFQKDCMETTFCGGEANVAVSLSLFGEESVFVTKLPDSDVGYAAARSLDYFKVDTSMIQFGNGRMGLYYLEKGASQRPSKIIYDREYSSLALANRKEFDWDTIFEGADWFHWTGINPALSDEMAHICENACIVAKKKGIKVSCDLNYRGKLWTPQKAQSVMKPMMKYVDVCICNEEDADKVLGIKAEGTDVEKGKLDEEGYISTAKKIHQLYGCSCIATTLRRSYSASRNGWRAMLYDTKAEKGVFSQEYDIQLVDRVGGGDSFSAGLIYALGQGMENKDVIEFATAASCLKQTIEGDFNRCTVSDVINLMQGNSNGRVAR